MQKVKWIFFAYLALVVLVIIGIGASLALAPQRDPHSLYLAYLANIRGLDPAGIADVESDAVAGQIFETLYNYRPQSPPYDIFPELAEKMPVVSPDNLTWTIRIRPGIHYFDPEKKVFPGGGGPELTANDFVFAFKRVADFHLASQNYSAYLEDKIVGINEWREYTQKTPEKQIDWDKPVEGLKALDKYTFQIKVIRPNPQMLFTLAHIPFAPMSRDVVKHWGDEVRNHPVGTGAYALSEYLQDQRVVLTANPIYRGQPDINGDVKLPESEKLPHIKRVQMDYFEEDLPAWALFQQGLFDVAGIPKDVFGQAISAGTGNLTPEMKAKGVLLHKAPEPDVWYFGFNMKDPVLGKNKALRQAMSMALDRPKYIEIFANGRGEPANGPIPPGFPTFDKDLKNPYTQYNLKAAREKMREAVRINGGPIPPIEFLLPGTDTLFRQMGEFMTQEMAQIGITIKPNYTTWARFQEMIDGKQAQFFSMGWIADYPDEQTFLQLFWGKNEAPGPNAVNYSNPEYDKLYEQAIVMNPGPEREALYKKMQVIVREDAPCIFNFHSVGYALNYDWVQNLHTNFYAHGLRKYVVLDEKLREERLSGRGPATTEPTTEVGLAIPKKNGGKTCSAELSTPGATSHVGGI